MFFSTSAMKGLKTSMDAKSDQVAPHWIEVKISYLINAFNPTSDLL